MYTVICFAYTHSLTLACVRFAVSMLIVRKGSETLFFEKGPAALKICAAKNLGEVLTDPGW